MHNTFKDYVCSFLKIMCELCEPLFSIFDTQDKKNCKITLIVK